MVLGFFIFRFLSLRMFYALVFSPSQPFEYRAPRCQGRILLSLIQYWFLGLTAKIYLITKLNLLSSPLRKASLRSLDGLRTKCSYLCLLNALVTLLSIHSLDDRSTVASNYHDKKIFKMLQINPPKGIIAYFCTLRFG